MHVYIRVRVRVHACIYIMETGATRSTEKFDADDLLMQVREYIYPYMGLIGVCVCMYMFHEDGRHRHRRGDIRFRRSARAG